MTAPRARDFAEEIYGRIEDFGGFLVKANSEGRPGPLDYGRTHADGANLLADALRPYGGVVMWRAFVHDSDAKWDRQAYLDFTPLDGKFADNTIVQIKNGPIDFQVREPAHPLFGSLPRTNSMIELQVTQEYTGHATHLCYLVPQWGEVLDFDTLKAGEGSTVARVVTGRVHSNAHFGFAGVMNFGDARNWTGSHLAAANTHGYGRLSWNPDLSARDLADEWTRMTFGNDPYIVETVSTLLLGSWRTYEDYTSPLGTGCLTHPPDGSVTGHFDPSPTTTTQFHKSDREGIGYDRTAATGDGFTELYAPATRDAYESLANCPEELLLFLHHVPYSHRLDSGKTVIQHIYDTHFSGAARVAEMRTDWEGLRRRVDHRRFTEVHRQFGEQLTEAAKWRDTLIAYWFELSRIRDEHRGGWLQAIVAPADTALPGGERNELPVRVVNATGSGLRTVTTLDVPEGWRSEEATAYVASREGETVRMTVVPPPAPALATLHALPRSGAVPVLDSSLRSLARVRGRPTRRALRPRAGRRARLGAGAEGLHPSVAGHRLARGRRVRLGRQRARRHGHRTVRCGPPGPRTGQHTGRTAVDAAGRALHRASAHRRPQHLQQVADRPGGRGREGPERAARRPGVHLAPDPVGRRSLRTRGEPGAVLQGGRDLASQRLRGTGGRPGGGLAAIVHRVRVRARPRGHRGPGRFGGCGRFRRRALRRSAGRLR
ncbi:hypothetical protein [Streptomyces sp. PRh5]|uniref:hypothetical protein n=1 Tax=Streptomyces sp. PRh5 TaxID=1158056 RepID=UPI0004B11573|nr:hypothetical protein [Streptomyces sp. PRh5]